jgi:hypothetical protein
VGIVVMYGEVKILIVLLNEYDSLKVSVLCTLMKNSCHSSLF